jgi:hypothetical protein
MMRRINKIFVKRCDYLKDAWIVGFDYACIMTFTYEMVRNVRKT